MDRSLINRTTVILSAVTILLTTGWSASEPVTVDGYYKSFFVAYDPPDFMTGVGLVEEPQMGAVSNRLRLHSRWRISSRVSFDADYNIAPRVQDRALNESSLFLSVIDPLTYRVTDFNSRLFPEQGEEVGSFAVFHNLDRAFVSVDAGSFDLYLGRQPIAWGSARAINPTDVIAPFTYYELDTEDRVGVDAVRARVPLGFMGEFDVGYIFGDDFAFDRSAFFLRGKFYTAGNDISLMTVGFRENLLLGFDLARSIGGAGFWAEAGYVIADALDTGDNADGDNYFRASVGTDYNLGGDTYGFFEYHYSGAGKNDAAEYSANASHTAFTDGAAYLLGKHYLIPGVTRQLTPLIGGGAELMINLGDPSALMAVSLEYNIAENIYLEAGGFVGIGSRPSLDFSQSISGQQIPDSEFGSYADTYYTSFRVYF